MVREGVSEEQRFSVKDAAVGGSGTGGRVHKEDDGGRDGTFRDIQGQPCTWQGDKDRGRERRV